ncbi:MAG: DUF3124 domain-containing protein, partial [Geobacteraceae bacterium]|nr:DUF3124 domain-containing protein [Geobacteraceae bacterium]
MPITRSVLALALVLLTSFVLLVLFPAHGICQVPLSKGNTLYVPVYSLVYTGDRAVPVNLASTLSIRNT